jgi:hypothetical protein
MGVIIGDLGFDVNEQIAGMISRRQIPRPSFQLKVANIGSQAQVTRESTPHRYAASTLGRANAAAERWELSPPVTQTLPPSQQMSRRRLNRTA